MKHICVSTLLIGTLSVWSAAQKPQTTAGAVRPTTAAVANHPQTTVQTVRPVTQSAANYPQTNVTVNRPQMTVTAVHPSTTVEVIHPLTAVEVVHPQTTVEVIHPQTMGNMYGQEGAAVNQFSANSSKPAGGGKGLASSQVPTSMSGFTPKQAKDFTSQKAAPIGGGENKLGNETNTAEKDAANKSSALGLQSNQNMNIEPNAKLGNLQSLGKAVEKKVEDKKK